MPLNEAQQNTESTLNAPCTKQIEGKISPSTHKMAILAWWGNPLFLPLISDLAGSLGGEGCFPDLSKGSLELEAQQTEQIEENQAVLIYPGLSALPKSAVCTASPATACLHLPKYQTGMKCWQKIWISCTNSRSSLFEEVSNVIFKCLPSSSSPVPVANWGTGIFP